MKYFLWIILVLFLAFSINGQLISPPNCGKRPLAPPEKIVNGIKAKPGDWSWSVSITTNNRHFCGGVLISDQWVLTAAHCFQGTIIERYIGIEIGVHNRLIKEQWTISSKISKIIRHEKWNLEFVANDIALIKLASPIKLDDTYIIPACLPETEDDSLDFDSQNKTAWLTGWGSSMLNGPLVPEKMQVSMELLTESRCKNIYQNMINTQSQLCAGEANVNKGACQGDSGGPFVRQMNDRRWYVVGLISWGYDCGQGTVFTKVSYFLSWIKNKISIN